MHGALNAPHFLFRRDIKLAAPNTIRFPVQRSDDGGEKLTADRSPFRAFDVLLVERLRGMLSDPEKSVSSRLANGSPASCICVSRMSLRVRSARSQLVCFRFAP